MKIYWNQHLCSCSFLYGYYAIILKALKNSKDTSRFPIILSPTKLTVTLVQILCFNFLPLPFQKQCLLSCLARWLGSRKKNNFYGGDSVPNILLLTASLTFLSCPRWVLVIGQAGWVSPGRSLGFAPCCLQNVCMVYVPVPAWMYLFSAPPGFVVSFCPLAVPVSHRCPAYWGRGSYPIGKFGRRPRHG